MNLPPITELREVVKVWRLKNGLTQLQASRLLLEHTGETYTNAAWSWFERGGIEAPGYNKVRAMLKLVAEYAPPSASPN